ncbi:hypothetical protein [Allosalinactinospora lopnorensis]|uniref:hypothetical protein n=1 Tax=Allosalinactinospora lopnorensis TaxID=1352348 RepID=UPI0006971E60|nr:hypothetical protein [Allosalinactinospora lopnorensis]
MARNGSATDLVASGAFAGVAGGLVFGAAMVVLGVLPTVASLVRVDSPLVGFVVHMAIAAVIGALFAVLVRHQSPGAGETVFWGLAYGMFWWYLGALTLRLVVLGQPVQWTVAAAQEAFPSLLGHLLYGATTGLVLAWIRQHDSDRAGAPPTERADTPVRAGGMLRGAVAGVVSAWLITAAVGEQYGPLAVSAAMAQRPLGTVTAAVFGLGILAGVGFAALYPRAPDAAGPSLVRGAGFGFLLWVVLGLTLVPLVEDGALAWSAQAVAEVFVTLPAYLLFCVAVAAVYTWIDRVWRLLFTAPVERADDEGPGARTLRAVGRGALAGCVGGLLFTMVMAHLDLFPRVARLVGGSSAGVGLTVHLTIALIVGVSYGLLFRRQTHDLAAAIGWGTSYGFLWWVLGGLTLFPVLLGGEPLWTAEDAANSFPSLVGHLAYGAGLGVTFHLLEARHDPWWVPRGAAFAARASRRRAQMESSAPAVWTLVVLMAFTVTVALGGAG